MVGVVRGVHDRDHREQRDAHLAMTVLESVAASNGKHARHSQTHRPVEGRGIDRDDLVGSSTGPPRLVRLQAHLNHLFHAGGRGG